MLEEIYEDNLLGDPNDLERILEPENDDQEQEGGGEDQEAGQDGTAAQEEAGETTTVKKRVVKRPQPKLNPERLTGPRGIIAIEEEFRDFKFYGKGHEKKDLDRVMKRLEHWAHRLFPRLQFDDCLEKIEKLGLKRPVVTYVKKIRMGMEVFESTPQLLDDNEDDLEGNIPQVDEPVIDPFEELLGRHFPQKTPDDLQTYVPDPTPLSQTISSSQMQPVQLSQTLPISQSPGLTTEQRERMLKNRMLAEERRLARYKMKLEMEKQSAEEETNIDNENDSLETNIANQNSTLETNLASEKETPETNMVIESETSETNMAIEIGTLETNMANENGTPKTSMTNDNSTAQIDLANESRTLETNMTNEIETTEANMTNENRMPKANLANENRSSETHMTNEIGTSRNSVTEAERSETQMDVDEFPELTDVPNSCSNVIANDASHNDEEHLQISEVPDSISNILQENNNEKDLETMVIPKSTSHDTPVSTVSESTSGITCQMPVSEIKDLPVIENTEKQNKEQDCFIQEGTNMEPDHLSTEAHTPISSKMFKESYDDKNSFKIEIQVKCSKDTEKSLAVDGQQVDNLTNQHLSVNNGIISNFSSSFPQKEMEDSENMKHNEVASTSTENLSSSPEFSDCKANTHLSKHTVENIPETNDRETDSHTLQEQQVCPSDLSKVSDVQNEKDKENEVIIEANNLLDQKVELLCETTSKENQEIQ